MIYLFVLLTTVLSHAENWSVQKSELTYEVKHLFKTVKGTSKSAKGILRCEKTGCEFLVAVPVKSFDSENSNRDAHMQNVMKAADFPMIEVRGKLPELSSGRKAGTLELILAGKSHTYKSELELKLESKLLTVNTVVPLVLSDFSIERPSLLMSAIEDSAPVQVHLELEQK